MNPTQSAPIANGHAGQLLPTCSLQPPARLEAIRDITGGILRVVLELVLFGAVAFVLWWSLTNAV